MATPDFEATYTISEAEFSRAHRFHLRRALLTVKNIGLLLIALVLMLGQAQVLGPAGWTGRLVLAIWAVFIGVIAYAFIRLPGQMYRRTESLQKEQKLSISASGIQFGPAEKPQRLEWDSIFKVLENGEFFLLYEGASEKGRSGGLPVVIPKRVLDSPEALENFSRSAHGRD